MKRFSRMPGWARPGSRLAGLTLALLVVIAPVFVPAAARSQPVDRQELTDRLVPVTGEEQRSVDLRVPFAVNSAELTARARQQLDELGAALGGDRLRSYDVGVYGHTDASGRAAYNQQLSERRAGAVVRYLVQGLGLEPARFRHAGYGEDRLLAGMPANSSRHRRVEIVVFAQAAPSAMEESDTPASPNASVRRAPETRDRSERVVSMTAADPAAPGTAPVPGGPLSPGSTESSGERAAVDEYEMLSAAADGQETAAVLVTGWHPVTGDETSGSTGWKAGLVAVTGDAFVKAVGGRGRMTEVRRYEHLPVIAMKVDAKGLAAAKGYDAGVRIWRDLPVVPYLDDSGPMVGAHGPHRGGYTGKGTFVAVVDTGVDVNHPFIAGRPVAEACFSSRCPNGKRRMAGPGAARPVANHGTHVAGIAVGRGVDMAGVAPEAGLIAINVFSRVDGKLGASNSTVLGALDWLIGVARSGRVHIASINMSLGSPRHAATPCQDSIYDLAVRLLAAEGVVIVAAAGNEGQTRGIAHPACVRGIVSVGAVDKQTKVADFSNSAPTLDILAPGVDILSSVPRSPTNEAPFKELPGTSMAAPHVAGAFAVLRQASPRSPVRDLYRALLNAGRQITDERNGIRKPTLNVAGALRALGVHGSDRDSGAAGGGDKGGQPPAKDEPANKDAPPSTGAPSGTEGAWQPIGG